MKTEGRSPRTITYKVSESAFYLQSVPGVGGDKKEDEGLTREELQEQERLR